MITTIVFDFGRVISAQKPTSLFQSYEEKLGLEKNSINTIMFDSPHWQRALVGKIDMDTYWQTIGPSLNLTSPQTVKRFQSQYYQDEKINSGVIHLIRKLRKTHKLAILSNNPRGLQQWLADWQIDELFDEVLCSADEGLTKPDVKIFELLLKRLNILPEETVFIDDTKEHIIASKTLGMHGVLFSTAEKLVEELTELGCFSNESLA